MLGNTILEGLGMGALLVLVCAVGIRNGAVGMVYLYSQEVQERLVGGTYERMDDPGHGGLETQHHRKGQAQKVVVRHGGHGGDRRSAVGSYDDLHPLSEAGGATDFVREHIRAFDGFCGDCWYKKRRSEHEA